MLTLGIISKIFGENYRIVRKVEGIFWFLPSLRTATTSCEL